MHIPTLKMEQYSKKLKFDKLTKLKSNFKQERLKSETHGQSMEWKVRAFNILLKPESQLERICPVFSRRFS